MQKILFSACLCGFPVRYNGSAKQIVSEQLDLWRQQNRLVTFCPELAAGFSTPRPPAEIQPSFMGQQVIAHSATVLESTGNDVTQRYILGAWLALQMAQQHHCRFALLTEGSPSCGKHRVYDGNFSHQSRAGMGVTAELLARHGIEVFSEHELLLLCQRVAESDKQAIEIP